MSTQTFDPTARAGFEEAMTASIVQSSPLSQTYLFYAHLICQCNVNFKSMKAPAAVSFNIDHYVLHIDPEKFNSFSLEQRCGVLKHEMLHILNGHLIRFEDRENFMKWNFATDCAINQLIDMSHLPSGCIYPNNLPVAQGVNVPLMVNSEQYYDLIDDDQLPEDQPEFGSGQPGPLDDHSEWENSQGTNETLQKDITKNMLEKAANETQKSRGNVPSEFSQWLELNTNARQLDWKRLLRSQISNKKTSSRRTILRSDRRFPKREDLRGKTKDRIATPVIVGDESGSVSSTELTAAIGECLNISKALNSPIWYVPVDTQAYKPHKLTSSQRNFKRTAFGGTTLSPAIDMIKSQKLEATCIVVITDGGICHSDIDAFQATNLPIIWLITSDGDLHPDMNQGKMRAFKLLPSN